MKKYLIPLLAILLAGCNATKNITSTLTSITGGERTVEGRFIDTTLAEDNPRATDEKSPNFEEMQKHIRVAPDFELINNDYAVSYLNEIMSKVLACWPKPVKEPITISISTARTYSASSAPGHIIVSLGVLNDVESEDELAFIITHELSHILLDHHDMNTYFQTQEDLVRTAGTLAIMKANIQDLEMVRSGKQVSFKHKDQVATQRRTLEAIKVGLTINRVSKDVISSSMAREKEVDADLLAEDLLVKAGYSAFGYGKAMERLQSSQVFTEEQLKAQKAEFQGVITLLSSDAIPAGGNTFETLKYLAMNEALTKGMQFLSHRHDSPEKRGLLLAKYAKREYRQERRRTLKTDEVVMALRKGKGGTIMTSYWNASESLRALEQGDLGQAEVLAQKAVKGPASGHVYPRLALYSVQKARGNSKKALASLNAIKNWDNASTQTFLMAARSYREAAMYDKAFATLTNARSVIGTEEPLYPEIIALHRDTDKSDKMMESLAACKNVNDQEIQSQCRIAAGIPDTDTQKAPGGNIFESLKNVFPI